MFAHDPFEEVSPESHYEGRFDEQPSCGLDRVLAGPRGRVKMGRGFETYFGEFTSYEGP